eukprot:TRINITY_DN74757_c0_g1_i1.p1 TRINITY_DN74757_c0_g1~~TRINITY_DN74757_c0_g1_i1.p1  ORF type:complete len:453 (+),score=-37.80 TRINITY_DN74757_c0_g1_i1:62-1360(+)
MASTLAAPAVTATIAPIRSASASATAAPSAPTWQQSFVGLQAQTGRVSAVRGCNPSSLSDRLFSTVAAATTAARPSGAGRRARVTMMPIGTPKVPYRTPGEGGWQWVDIWNVLYRERIIFIGQFMDEEYTNQVLATMLYLDSVDSNKPMYMYINSPGGELTPTLALYDTIGSIKSPVGTLALGYAYNNAGFLLAAGTKGLRVAMPMTRVALQSPAGAARGQADDIQNEAKELMRVRAYVFGEIAKMSGQPVEKRRRRADPHAGPVRHHRQHQKPRGHAGARVRLQQRGVSAGRGDQGSARGHAHDPRGAAVARRRCAWAGRRHSERGEGAHARARIRVRGDRQDVRATGGEGDQGPVADKAVQRAGGAGLRAHRPHCAPAQGQARRKLAAARGRGAWLVGQCGGKEGTNLGEPPWLLAYWMMCRDGFYYGRL